MMPCNGCHDKPRTPNPAAFQPRSRKVYWGARLEAEAATRAPGFKDAVLSRAAVAGVEGASIHILETDWLSQCRSRYPILDQNHPP
jgi:hypothetical protein